MTFPRTIGFSIAVETLPEAALVRIVRDMQAAGCTAFELNMTGRAPRPLGAELVAALLGFAYRSVHLPLLESAEHDPATVAAYQQLAQTLDVQSCTIHPHVVRDWPGLEAAFAGRLAVENMDWRKPADTRPADMAAVFAAAPSAQWAFDVNHIYSLDPTMRLAGEFYDRFGGRLAHYHLSGFGGEAEPHLMLAQTGQDIILTALRDDKPIIIESLSESTLPDFRIELDYIRQRL
jgi:hypothetical protein